MSVQPLRGVEVVPAPDEMNPRILYALSTLPSAQPARELTSGVPGPAWHGIRAWGRSWHPAALRRPWCVSMRCCGEQLEMCYAAMRCAVDVAGKSSAHLWFLSGVSPWEGKAGADGWWMPTREGTQTNHSRLPLGVNNACILHIHRRSTQGITASTRLNRSEGYIGKCRFLHDRQLQGGNPCHWGREI